MKRVFLLTVALVCVVAIAAGLGRTDAARDAQFFSTILRSYATEEVWIHETAYLVENGIVTRRSDGALIEGLDALPALRLTYATLLARNSPLMALPGNEPTDLLALIARLEQLQEDIARLQKDSESSRAVKKALYPLSFLKAMVKSEETRQRFLAKATEENLDAHVYARTAAIAAYRADLAAYTKQFNALIPKSSARYLMGDRLVTDDDMRTLLAHLSRSIDSSETRNRTERMCLTGATSRCAPLALVALPPERVAPDIVDPSTPDLIRKFSRISPNLSYQGPDPDITNVLLSQSACVSKDAAPLLFTVRSATSTDGSNFEYRKVRFIGEFRFIMSDRFPAVPFYKYFADRDVIYLPTSPLLHYVCPEFGQDIARVRSVDAVRLFAQRWQLGAQYNHASLATLEQWVTHGDTDAWVVRESAAREYLSEAFLLMRTGTLEPRAAHELKELMLSMRYLTAGWGDALELVLEADEANVRLLQKGLPVDLEAPYAFFFRSPVLFLYMADNPSVGSGAQLGGTPMNNNTAPYVYYSKLELNEQTIQKVARDSALYTLIHQMPLSTPLESVFAKPQP